RPPRARPHPPPRLRGRVGPQRGGESALAAQLGDPAAVLLGRDLTLGEPLGEHALTGAGTRRRLAPPPAEHDGGDHTTGREQPEQREQEERERWAVAAVPGSVS